MKDKEIKKGNSLIQLAQIIIILAGFSLLSGIIIYTNAVNILSKSLDLITFPSITIIKQSIYIASFLAIIGCIEVILSILLWYRGYIKINKN